MNYYYAALDWIHLIGTVTWIGGMIFYVLILMPSMKAIEPSQAGKLVGALTKRYAIFVWGAIILLIVTGILISLNRNVRLFQNTRGILLGIKHIVIACMIIVGAVISKGIGPRLAAPPKLPPDSAAPPSGPPPQIIKLRKLAGRLGSLNLLLGIAVLALTTLSRWL